MATRTEMETVPRETQALILAPPDGAYSTPVAADARAEALSWSPNTRRAYVASWKDFTSWCLENRCAGLPATPSDVGLYLEHLLQVEGRALGTARLRLAAIAAAHRLSKHPDPTSNPLVKATMKRLTREHGNPGQQAKGLTTGIQRVHPGMRRRKESEAQAAKRALVDLALLEVMRGGLFRRSEAAALRWNDLEFHEDGSGRLHVAGSKAGQTDEGKVRCLGPAAVEALLAIRPEEAAINPARTVFGLSAGQICRRIKAATKMTGLGEGFSAQSLINDN